MIAFVNNEFIEEDKASLKLNDLAIQRGYGVFDFFRTKNSVPLFLDDYIDRFYSSISLLNLEPLHTKQELKGLIKELIQKNNLPESGIKLLLTGGYSTDNYQPATPNFVLTQQSVQITTPEKFSQPVKVISYEHQRELPQAKSINYLTGVWLQPRVKEAQATDVLYHRNGMVTEFPRSNIFIVTKEHKLVTPLDNILAGITRKKLLALASSHLAVEARPVHLDEVKDAAEVFMTSTTKRLLPIKQVDDILIGNGSPGPVSSSLSDAFIKMENEYIEAFKW
jgi:D-alanine transaminase/branched-chain amino acid aminotransferase